MQSGRKFIFIVTSSYLSISNGGEFSLPMIVEAHDSLLKAYRAITDFNLEGSTARLHRFITPKSIIKGILKDHKDTDIKRIPVASFKGITKYNGEIWFKITMQTI